MGRTSLLNVTAVFGAPIATDTTAADTRPAVKTIRIETLLTCLDHNQAVRRAQALGYAKSMSAGVLLLCVPA
jgi:hypothetical protein